MGWTRRSVLAASLLGAGCTLDANPAPTATTRPVTGATSSPAPRPSAQPITTSPPPSPQPPDRGEIVTEFAGREPTVFGTKMPGVTSRIDQTAVALTFDACGGPHGSGVDADLLALLRRLRVPATLFLNLRWIEANAALAGELAADELFQLGSHGRRHVPLSVSRRRAYGITGTADAGEVYDELTATHAWFTQATGSPPGWFRPGTAHLDDVAAVIAARIGLRIAGFTVNGDAGATASRREVSRSVSGSKQGDIVLAHLNRPAGQTSEGFVDALPRLLEAGMRFTTLG